MITPEDAFEKARLIMQEYPDDPGPSHIKLDSLLCDILLDLGYEKLVDVYLNSTRWYE